MPNRLALLLLPLCAGCLVRNLRAPVEDHAVQATVIAEGCKSERYAEAPCSKELQEDLDAMAQQAKCINAAIAGKTCDDG